MTETFSARTVLPLRVLLLVSLVAGLVYYVVVSIHWPVVWDAAVMHYVIFLIEKGLKPYRDITDSNMPGSYLVEGLAMHIFGRGDLAWRLYDLFLCGALTLASIEITRPTDWLAGLFGGIFFTLLHGSDGPRFTGERDLVMTVLLVCSLAFLFRALRSTRDFWMLPFGLAGGMAAAIKPTSIPVVAILLAAATVLLRRRRVTVAPYLLWTLAGFVGAGALVIAFLIRYHAVHDFFFVVKHLLPSYVSLRQLGAMELLRLLLPRSVIFLTAMGVFLALKNRGWDAERWMLLACFVFGAFSYFYQRKGYPYHRYPLIAFLFLLLGMEVLGGLRRSGISRAAAALVVLLFVLVTEPHMLRPLRAESRTFPVNFDKALTADLNQLGPDRLEGNVACFDLTYGCFSALYHLGVTQSSGFTGDLLFFSPTETEAVDFYRNMFWRLNAQRSPDVLVVTNQWFQENNTFSKLQAWPAFDTYLQSNYTLTTSRSFPVSDDPPPPGDPPLPAYRIYIRKGSSIAELAPRT